MTSEPKRRGRPRKNPLPEVEFSTQTGSHYPSETVLTPSGTMSVTLDAVDPVRSLKVHIYPSFKEQSVGGIPRVVEAQTKYLPQFGIEIVEDPEEADVIAYHVSVPETYVKRFPRKTFVSIIHGFYWSEYDWDNWSLKVNVDAMEGIRVSDSVITCSEWVANSIRRHTSRPVQVIPHGIDTEEWVGGETIDYVLWNKFRVDPVCDPEPLNKVAEMMPDVQFISTFGADLPNINRVGELPFNASKQAVEHAAVYLCTTRETFGIGTLEAMSCGVPVVGFNWGGQSEFIEHLKDGYLVEPGDIRGLSEGIRWALENREEVGAAARSKAAQFTWQSACQKYAEEFRKAHARKTAEGPRTSIIVTAYKLEQYLNNTLESVLAQDDQDWECIVVDDSSPDSCGEIAESWARRDNRFKVIHNEKNVYLAEARNIGIRAASGRYILPLDADDMLAPGAIRNLADALDSDRSIHVAYGGVFFIDEDGTPTEYGFGPGKSSWPFPFVHEQQMMQRNLLPYSSMFRKEAWEYTGGYRRRCRTAEDADMWTRFSSYGFRPKMVIPEPCLIYRNREGSMSRTNSSNWIRWFSWSKLPQITPAGAITEKQLPIPSLEPLRISVIIPVGPGHEKLVTDAVDSVDTQSFRNWECIVVNDTGKPLQTELPAWVRVIDTSGNRGVAHARNVGIAASRGSLFLPLDADDYLQPDALQLMYEAHRESMEVVYCDFWQDVPRGQITHHKTDDYNPQYITGKSRERNGQKVEGMMHSVTALTPKVFWQRVGGYDETLPAWEDWDFQIALGAIGVCSRRVAAPLFFYRKNTGFRREENYNHFDEGKEAILRKWGQFFEGGRELMACSSCRNKGKTFGISGTPMTMTGPSPNQEAKLLMYTGEHAGSVKYRGNSKTMYSFKAGEAKWVLAQDVELFLNLGDFKEVAKPVAQPTEPVLVAEGQ